jgi:hypothetical protein
MKIIRYKILKLSAMKKNMINFGGIYGLYTILSVEYNKWSEVEKVTKGFYKETLPSPIRTPNHLGEVECGLPIQELYLKRQIRGWSSFPQSLACDVIQFQL